MARTDMQQLRSDISNIVAQIPRGHVLTTATSHGWPAVPISHVKSGICCPPCRHPFICLVTASSMPQGGSHHTGLNSDSCWKLRA